MQIGADCTCGNLRDTQTYILRGTFCTGAKVRRINEEDAQKATIIKRHAKQGWVVLVLGRSRRSRVWEFIYTRLKRACTYVDSEVQFGVRGLGGRDPGR
eukprot:scaffold80256_cov14-Tisochrysis_lutea.AAC.1